MEEEKARIDGRRRKTSGAGVGLQIVVLVVVLWSAAVEAATDPADAAALRAVKAALVDPNGALGNWLGGDPCGLPWNGIFCETDAANQSHVEEIRLFRVGLGGTLAPEVGNLQSLRSLNLEWNSLTGGLPASIGNLSNLELLLVNGNNMTGPLPPALGKLAKLNRIQIDQNMFSGPIPAELANLRLVQHLHMNNNSLSGQIPAVLGSLPNVIHILLDNNQLTGTLPPDLANSTTLQILQLDNNPFDAQPIPPSYGSFRSMLVKLSLRNCNLQGPTPNLSGLASLEYLDLSFNNLTGGLPRLTGVANISAVILSDNDLAQNVTGLSLGNVPNLQALVMARNSFFGTLDAAQLLGATIAVPQRVVDFQSNQLDFFVRAPAYVSLWLANNTNICQGQVSQSSECTPQPDDLLQLESVHQNDPSLDTCETQTKCSDPRASPKLIRGGCHCLYALQVGYRLKSPSFTMFAPYEERFREYMADGITVASGNRVALFPDLVNVLNYTWVSGPRLRMEIQLFPDPGPGNATTAFTKDEVSTINGLFANWQLPDDRTFGPYEFISWNPSSFYAESVGGSSKNGISAGAVVGIVLAAVAATAIFLAVFGIWFFRRHKKHLLKWRPTRRFVGADEEKLRAEMRSKVRVTGLREFMYEDLARATDNFSAARKIGQGGYGHVFSGEVEPSGEKVAIKRAQEGSLQGSREFYTEIELLSRVHHRNLVRLIGFCDDEGEQMLVYEFMEGGTLREHLSGTGGRAVLDLAQRLRIAMGSARGIAYLHNEASPPIFHRDIKTSNVLLDGKGNAKVADFGLSKLAPTPDMEGTAPGHVSTVVKGTPGYLDPEYFLTHKLTDKSDVYSFGVVLLELVTGLYPISNGRNIVREVQAAVDRGALLTVVDARMGWYPSEAISRLVHLALACSSDSPDKRPTILEVVRDLEDIWRGTPWGGGDTDLDSYATGSDTHSNTGSLPSSGFFTDHHQHSTDYPTSGLTSGTVIDVAPR